MQLSNEQRIFYRIAEVECLRSINMKYLNLINQRKMMNLNRLRRYWILEELGFVLALSVPIAIESATEGFQMKLSNLLIGRKSGNEIAKALSGLFIGQTVVTVLAFTIAEGLGAYVNVLCSQSFGAKQHKLVGLYYYRALFMSFLTCVPVFTIYISVRPIVYFLFRDHELAEYSGSYTDILCFGYPAYLYSKIGIRFLQALNIVWGPALYLIIGLILNGIVQYILIFQYNTSVQGAAAGYVISNYLVALLVFSHIQLSRIHTTMSHEWSLQFISDWYHTSRYGGVIIIQWLIGSLSTTIVPILCLIAMANSEKQLAIYSILFSIWWVFAAGIMGIGSAITVRVGNLLGANEQQRAKRAAIFDITIAMVLLVVCNVLVFTTSDTLSHLFTTDEDFAKELKWNLMIFSFLLYSEIKLVIQGLMNACCKQGIQTMLKFVFLIIIGTVASFLLVHFVEWKALSILVQYSATNVICSVLALLILFCSNWNNIAKTVSKNTNKSVEEQNMSNNHTKPANQLPKWFVLCRYVSSFVVSICCIIIVLIVVQL